MLPNGPLPRIISYLSSTRLAVGLFCILALGAIPGTFTDSKAIYHSFLYMGLLGLMALNLLCCTITRRRALAPSTLVIHGGVLVTLVGCVVSSFGYVATVNIYEGTYADQVFRWDKNTDMPLDMQLWVKRVNREYYPVRVQVGVLRGGEKFGLYELQTGEGFDVPGYRIVPTRLEPRTQELFLAVYGNGHQVGIACTSGKNSLPAGFPYDFRLVRYKTPIPKRVWVDLLLARGGATLGAGTAEINGPFDWGGLSFYNTQIGTDPSGLSFAGIQIVRDPGRPVVFAGFTILGLGAVLAMVRRLVQRKEGV